MGAFSQGSEHLGFVDTAGLPAGVCLGVGIRTLQDARQALRAGADKVAVNTAAVRRPELVTEISRHFGAQCMVLSIEAKRRPNGDGWWVFTDNGREHSGLDVIEWAERGVELGAGEILLTSVDREGTRKGFDMDLTRAVSEAVSVPVIASGGAGTLEHLNEALSEGQADAVLAASIFHYGTYSIAQAKEYLEAKGVPVRHPPKLV